MKTIILFAILASLSFAQIIPEYEWVHPKPFGIALGWIKAWDANTIYAFGSSGNFLKSTDAGQTFSIKPIAGVQGPLPYSTYNDIYAAHF